MDKIYFTGNNTDQVKAFVKKSNNAYTADGEEGHLLVVFRDGSNARTLKPLDEITTVTSDGDIVVVDNTRKIEMIADMCHSVNAAYCRSQGDNSQEEWTGAPDWQKSSAVKGVTMHLLNPAASPSMSHESWMAEKVADGWVYGEEKDEKKKTHPCMVEYDELPKEQQAKDYIFKAIVCKQATVYFPELNAQLVMR